MILDNLSCKMPKCMIVKFIVIFYSIYQESNKFKILYGIVS